MSIKRTAALESLFIATIMANILSPAASHAQESSARTLEEVIVTAERREASLQDTPVSVTSLGLDEIINREVTAVSDIGILVPSLNMSQFQGAIKINLRGVGTDLAGPNIEAGVGFFQDNFYRGGSYNPNALLFDLSRIEVLRGPQGTLYGRNTTGGSVNVITRLPGDELGLEFLQTVGNYEYLRTELRADVPLADGFSIRVGGFYEDRDGYYENVLPGGHEAGNEGYGGRLVAVWDPSEQFRAIFRMESARADRGDPPWAFFTEDTVAPGFFSPFNLGGVLSFPGSCGPVSCEDAFGIDFPAPAMAPPSDIRELSHNTPTTEESDQDSYSLVLSWQIGDLNVKSLTSYLESSLDSGRDTDGTDVSLLIQRFGNHNEELSQEINISGSAFNDRLQWIGGAFYYKQEVEALSQFDLPDLQRFFESFAGLSTVGMPFPPGVLQFAGPRHDGSTTSTPFFDWDYSQDTESLAFFGQGTFSLSDSLRLTVGARWTEDDKEMTQSIYSNGVVSGLCTGLQLEERWDEVTGKVGLDYDVGRDSLAYGSIATGYKSGGFNAGACGNTFDPETLTAAEVGYKTMLNEGAATVNVAAHYAEYDDYQGNVYVEGTSRVQNAGKATIWGLELEGRALVGNNFELSGNVAYLDTEFDEYLGVNPLGAPGALEDFSGNELIRSPEWQGLLTGQYNWVTEGAGEFEPILEVSYRDEVHYTDANLAQGLGSSGTTWNTRLTWYPRPAERGFFLQLYVNNLTDEEMETTLVPNGIIGATLGYWNTPRTYGVRLSASW